MKAQFSGILLSSKQISTSAKLDSFQPDFSGRGVRGESVPILGIMSLLQRITCASMTPCKHSISLPRHLWRIQLQIHQFIHILQDQHVAIKLYQSIILGHGEGNQLSPAVVEARIVAVVFLHRRLKIIDFLMGDLAIL